MMTTLNDRRNAATGVEAAFAKVLAEVMRVDQVSIDSHFFDELGADSLVMAHFCARVRKRGNLPPVSMRDVYRYPTISSLAAGLAAAAPLGAEPPARAAVEAPTPTNTREYILCGALQALFFLSYSYAGVLAVAVGYIWVSAGSNAVEI